jgi:hypothetical protein
MAPFWYTRRIHASSNTSQEHRNPEHRRPAKSMLAVIFSKAFGLRLSMAKRLSARVKFGGAINAQACFGQQQKNTPPNTQRG